MKYTLPLAITLLLLNLSLANSAQATPNMLFNTPAAEAPPPSNDLAEQAVVVNDEDEDDDDEGCT
ncbi:MAG: hypothetical protein Q9O24_08020 [Gammaproteobacteria bacterium]|nr:hypothetical protein [Gammaproteobacteria bacterium]